MPRQKTITLYKYSELSDSAKARARDWYRQISAGDTTLVEYACEDFADVLKACGFDVRMQRDTRTRTQRAIYWDTNPIGGAFDASWSAARVKVAPLIADRPVSYVDKDGKLQACESNARLVLILERVAALAAANPGSYGDVNPGRGCSVLAEWFKDDCRDIECTCDDDAQEFESIARDLGHFLGRSVADEFEYQTSDEYIAEAIEANECEFTEDGESE
jgi:hypothetical protein